MGRWGGLTLNRSRKETVALRGEAAAAYAMWGGVGGWGICLLYTSPSPRDTPCYLVCRLLLEKIFLMIRRPPRSTLRNVRRQRHLTIPCEMCIRDRAWAVKRRGQWCPEPEGGSSKWRVRAQSPRVHPPPVHRIPRPHRPPPAAPHAAPPPPAAVPPRQRRQAGRQAAAAPLDRHLHAVRRRQ